MPMPVYYDGTTKGTVAAGCGSWGFGVTRNAKDVQAAATVVEYFTSAESSEMMYSAIGTFLRISPHTKATKTSRTDLLPALPR